MGWAGHPCETGSEPGPQGAQGTPLTQGSLKPIKVGPQGRELGGPGRRGEEGEGGERRKREATPLGKGVMHRREGGRSPGLWSLLESWLQPQPLLDFSRQERPRWPRT